MSSGGVVLEQLDVVFAGRGREQHHQIVQRVVKVLGLAHLLDVQDAADPDLVQVGVVLQQILEIDGIDGSAFAIGLAVDNHRFLDIGQCRARAQRLGIDACIGRIGVAEQFKPIVGQVVGVVIKNRLARQVQVFEADTLQQRAVLVIDPRQPPGLALVDQAGHEPAPRIDRQHLVEDQGVEIRVGPLTRVGGEARQILIGGQDGVGHDQILVAARVQREIHRVADAIRPVGSEGRGDGEFVVKVVGAKDATEKVHRRLDLLARFRLVPDDAKPGPDA